MMVPAIEIVGIMGCIQCLTEGSQLEGWNSKESFVLMKWLICRVSRQLTFECRRRYYKSHFKCCALVSITLTVLLHLAGARLLEVIICSMAAQVKAGAVGS